MMQFMQTVPKHFAAGAVIVLAGSTGACALVTWYVRYSSVFSRGSDNDGSNQIGMLIATAGVLVGFIALIVAALGVAMAVLARGVAAARAAGRLDGAGVERTPADHAYLTICRRAPDGTWSASSPEVPGIGVGGCVSRDQAVCALRLAIERHAARTLNAAAGERTCDETRRAASVDDIQTQRAAVKREFGC